MASVSPRTVASGEARWRVQVRVKGQMKQTTFLEKKGADQFAALVDRVGWEAADQVRQSRGQRDDGTPTLREYTNRYLSPDSGLLTGVEKGTREGYEAEAERSWMQLLGDVPVDLITKPDVQKIGCHEVMASMMRPTGDIGWCDADRSHPSRRESHRHPQG